MLLCVNISPALCSAPETLCSLAFAERCNALELGAVGCVTGATTEERLRGLSVGSSPGWPVSTPVSSRRELSRRSSFSVNEHSQCRSLGSSPVSSRRKLSRRSSFSVSSLGDMAPTSADSPRGELMHRSSFSVSSSRASASPDREVHTELGHASHHSVETSPHHVRRRAQLI